TTLPLVHATGPAMAAQRMPRWVSVALVVAAPIARIAATSSRLGRTIFGVSVMRRSPVPARSRCSYRLSGRGVEQVQLLLVEREPDRLVGGQPDVRRNAHDDGLRAEPDVSVGHVARRLDRVDLARDGVPVRLRRQPDRAVAR